ncbi:MAG: HPr family phosphocarrier protein [Acidobacteriota bacterium]|nr:HPr family phosphocarrier protein [Acidobacteriota bacterium]
MPPAEANIKIVNQLGLHARAAAQLVRLAGTFKSRITLMRLDNEVVADAKSILSVLTLAAGKGTELKLTVEGADEQQAFDAVKEIFAKGFGEI